jgi:FKBP-type peptidyl-prolyl cis-trans isomerase
LKRYKCIKTDLKSQLFRYFTFAELGSDSYDDLALTLPDLTGDGGVKKLVLRKGEGKKVIQGGNLWMHYITFVEGNDEPIDSTRNKELLTAYKVGGGQMLPGVEICVTSMEVGEIAKVLIKPEYAYGKFGCPTLIPPCKQHSFSFKNH